ncbi:hypothetical protein Q9L58_000076 [Maublancomyces gigas]|uniref:DUF7909 domain-containing protein n=1 Tax=Discina gigas TaxID=1032678 RepID=A0ABR3GXZ6_9PEZI
MFATLLQSTLLLAAALSTASAICVLPSTEPLSNNITTGFAIQVQNTSYPIINNRLMNLWQAGGGDRHLYLFPAGDQTSNLTLQNGIITRLPIRAVINGEYTATDNTTKIFMTERGDPRAFFDVIYGCNQTDGSVQKELSFSGRGTLPGGHICVRLASGDRYEFRYSPPGNTATARLCMKVTLAIMESEP